MIFRTLLSLLAVSVMTTEAAACETTHEWFAVASNEEIRECVTLDFLSQRASDQSTFLHLAVEAGVDTALLDGVIEVYPEEWAELLKHVNSEEQTALHRAAEVSDDPALVMWLIAAGMDTSAIMPPVRTRRLLADEGTTPLHLAAMRPDGAPLVRALLAGAADPSIKDAKGYQPIHFAARTAEDTDTLAAFLAHDGIAGVFDEKDGAGNTALITAAATDRPYEVMRFLLQAGAKTGIANEDGFTALHVAAKRATEADVVSILLDWTEDPCVSSETVSSPMDILRTNTALSGDADLMRTFHETCREGR